MLSHSVDAFVVQLRAQHSAGHLGRQQGFKTQLRTGRQRSDVPSTVQHDES